MRFECSVPLRDRRAGDGNRDGGEPLVVVFVLQFSGIFAPPLCELSVEAIGVLDALLERWDIAAFGRE